MNEAQTEIRRNKYREMNTNEKKILNSVAYICPRKPIVYSKSAIMRATETGCGSRVRTNDGLKMARGAIM